MKLEERCSILLVTSVQSKTLGMWEDANIHLGNNNNNNINININMITLIKLQNVVHFLCQKVMCFCRMLHNFDVILSTTFVENRYPR